MRIRAGIPARDKRIELGNRTFPFYWNHRSGTVEEFLVHCIRMARSPRFPKFNI